MRLALQEEATSSNAQTHIKYFKTQLSYFNLNFDDWCLLFIGDSCNTNKNIANDCNKPNIGCTNHNLNIEVNTMLDIDTDFK